MRWLPYILAAGVSVPWLVVHLSGQGVGNVAVAVLSGVAILGAAFLLSWACEVAEEDVPQALAVSVLALVAVLPEYAVDATFAWKAATDPEAAGYAIANMTGGNRLMLGFGWTLVCVLNWAKFRRTRVVLARDVGAEVTILLLSTLYALVPVWRGSLTLFDTAVYVTLYLLYLVAAARGESHETDPVGPAAVLAHQATGVRRVGVIGLLVFGAGVILLSAEPFAESLVHTGKEFGIDEFVLVQWVAPLASEAPEVVVATLMVWRGASQTGLRALVSSSVNQWTLLVGTLAVVVSLASGGVASLPLDGRQADEMLLTAAQCLFGVVVIADLRLELWQAGLLGALFLIQPLLPEYHHVIALGYLALFVAVLVFDKRSRRGIAESIHTFWLLLTNTPRPVEPEETTESGLEG
jgi:cation:H+ antiporter